MSKRFQQENFVFSGILRNTGDGSEQKHPMFVNKKYRS